MLSKIAKYIVALGLPVIGVSLSACSLVPGLNVDVRDSDQGAIPDYRVVNVTPEVIIDQRLRAAAIQATANELAAADPSSLPPAYLIGPGDVLQVVVWDHVELTNPFGSSSRDAGRGGQLVAPDGTIFFPYAGTVHVSGKTVQQVRAELAESLSGVITRPQVDVRVAEYRAGRVQVTGEVKNPGLVTTDDTVKGVLEAINERGGFTSNSSRRTALLIRGGKRYDVDTANLLWGDRPTVNPALQAGDIIHVPDTGNDQVYVLGEANRQGAVVMGQQQMTLTEVLTKSGGLDRLSSNDSGVVLFRKPTTPAGAAEIFAFDLSNPSGLLLAGEFTMASRDVVYVKATKFSQYNRIINQILPTITFIYQLDRLTPVIE